MQVLHLNKITINHAGRDSVRELNWALNEHERVGLGGPNGAGKSSLLKAIAGEVTPEVGVITQAKGVRVGFLPQEGRITPGLTVYQEAMLLPPELARVDAELTQ